MPQRLLALCCVLAVAVACGDKAKSGATAASRADAGEAPLKLDPFWADPAYLTLKDDGPCPDGFWALFPLEAPGADAAEKKANEARRAELAARLRAATYVTETLDVKLGEFDSGKGEIPVTVKGSLDCTDSAGRVTIALAPARPELPENRDFGQYQWVADRLAYARPLKLSEASAFKRTHQTGLGARLVFKLGKAENHKKLERITESPEERAERLKHDIPGGGGIEDWGAGRMIRADVLGTRVAIDKGRTLVVEQRR